MCSIFFLASCANEVVQQASYNVNNERRLVDSEGWYRFAGYSFKGTLSEGNPHGRGLCRNTREEKSVLYWSGPEVACEFNRGVRVDQQYLNETGQTIADAASKRNEEAREAARREDIWRAEERERDRERAQADRESYKKWKEDALRVNPAVAESNKQNAEMYERGLRQRQQQIQNDRAEQKNRAESEAAWAKLNQPRSTNTPSAPSRGGLAETSQQDQERQRRELQAQLAANQQGRNRNEEQLQQQARVQPRNPPSLASVSNSGSSRNSSDQQVSNTPKQSTAATRTVTAEGDSQTCHARPIAESQARIGAELDGRNECEALGKGWGLDTKTPRFAGYLGCTPCTSRWEQGNFRCKVTQAMYNCKHR